DLYKIINSDLSLDEMVAMHIGSEPNKCRFQQSFYSGTLKIEEHYVGMKCERYATYHIMKAAIVDLYKLLDRSTAESMVGDLQSIENCDYSVRFLDNRITDRLRLSDNIFYWLLNRLSLSLIPDYFKHAEIYTIAIRNHNTQTETQHDFKYSRNSLEGLLFFFGLAFEGAGQELLNYERDFADRVPGDFQDAFQASVKNE
ncbi:MAG: hypothetical protein KDK34_17685, partial [Leptospiraceae bacterium]|nr:hypothetical protein [Leptospiraceae bacterium]